MCSGVVVVVDDAGVQAYAGAVFEIREEVPNNANAYKFQFTQKQVGRTAANPALPGPAPRTLQLLQASNGTHCPALLATQPVIYAMSGGKECP